MKRIRKYTYGVKRTEMVIFTVTPLNGAGPRVTVSQNGKTVPKSGRATPRFEFKCDEVVGNNHFATLEFSFLPGDPDDAEFALELASGGGTKFKDFPNIKKKNKTRLREFRFVVERE